MAFTPEIVYTQTAGQAPVISGKSVKTIYCAGVTDANGSLTIYLTDNGLITGNAMFTVSPAIEITAVVNAAAGISTTYATYRPISVDLKTLIIDAAKGTTNVLGLTSSAVPAAGVTVKFKIEGI